MPSTEIPSEKAFRGPLPWSENRAERFESNTFRCPSCTMSVHHISHSLRIVERDLEEAKKNFRDRT